MDDERRGRDREEKGKDGEEEGRGKEREGEEEETGSKERVKKITLWNVAGIGGKDNDFWEGMEQWVAVVLMETGLEEKG